jgi:hypothetical protein
VPQPERLPEDAVRPFLSIVLTGRNDSYGSDFNERFFRTIGFNHRELRARGIAHEFVFIEWAPSPEVPRLLDLVFDAVPGLARHAVRWFLVDPRYQDALSLRPQLRYLEFVAKNVGLRRAQGRFVLSTNCDIYLGRTVLDRLEAGTLEPRTVYRAPRHDLKLAVDQTNLDWDLLEDPRNLDGAARRLKPPYMAGGTGDFILLDRETFHGLHGFNEIYRLVRAGIDRNFVVKAMSAGLPLADIGGAVYHINHVGSFRRAKTQSDHANAASTSAGERWNANAVIYQNPATWGLAAAPERPLDDGSWYLDFSWAAVPPLVNLRAVLVPSARRSDGSADPRP